MPDDEKKSGFSELASSLIVRGQETFSSLKDSLGAKFSASPANEQASNEGGNQTEPYSAVLWLQQQLALIDAQAQQPVSVIKKFSDTIHNKKRTITELAKANLIHQFIVPNDKLEIYRFLALASSNIDESLYGLIPAIKGRTGDQSNKEDYEYRRLLSDAWKTRYETEYYKARRYFGNDPDFAPYERAFLIRKGNEIIRKERTRNVIVAISAGLVLLIAATAISLSHRENSVTVATVSEYTESVSKSLPSSNGTDSSKESEIDSDDAERLAQQEEEQESLAKEKEEADRLAKEEADRLAKEEADRLAKEEADRLAKEKADRLAKEKEEKEKQAAEEARLKEEEENKKAAEEAAAKEKTEQELKEKEEAAIAQSEAATAANQATPSQNTTNQAPENNTQYEERSRNATVFVTATGSKYHSYGCRYLKDSCYEISLEEAIAQNYEPCSVCSPPRP